jgi:hypothetical protein
VDIFRIVKEETDQDQAKRIIRRLGESEVIRRVSEESRSGK